MKPHPTQHTAGTAFPPGPLPPPDLPASGDAPDALEVMKALARAPTDAPGALVAHAGLMRGLQALADKQPLVGPLRDLIAGIPTEAVRGLQAPATGPDALWGRKGENHVWALLLYLGAADADTGTEAPAAVAVGNLVLSLLRGDAPTSHTLARVRAVVSRPDGQQARDWPEHKRSRDLARLANAIAEAIAQDPDRARAIRLDVPPTAPTEVQSRNQAFNRLVTRRMANISEAASVKARRGVSGHGAADTPSLRATAHQLRAATGAGDLVAMRDVLALVTGLTDDLLDALPLSAAPDEAGVAPHLWLDLDASCLHSHVAVGERDRARPAPAARRAYLPVADSVRIVLPTWWATAVATAAIQTGRVITLGDVLPRPSCARRRLDGGPATTNRLSVSCLRRELISERLEDGEQRYPLAVALHAPYLVSVGRKAYGALRQRQVEAVLARAYAGIGWVDDRTTSPHAESSLTAGDPWIGARVVVRDETIVDIVRFLDRRTTMPPTPGLQGLVVRLNAIAAAVAVRLALGLALRNRLEYPVTRHDLLTQVVYVQDKDVGHGPGAGIPVVPLLRDTMARWHEAVDGFDAALSSLDAPEARRLRERIALWREEPHAPAIWYLDAALQMEGAGSATWLDRLPPALAVVGNFARHWWATELTAQGVHQVMQDALLRHSAAGLEIGGPAAAWPMAVVRARLASAMENALGGLELTAPPPWQA